MENGILSFLAQADTIGSIIGFSVLVCYGIYRAYGEIKKRFFNKKKKEENDEQSSSSGDDIISIERISDTYIDIIKQLRREVQNLKQEMEELSKLRDENTKMKLQILELESINHKQEQEIRALSGKIKRLERKANAIRKPTRKKSSVKKTKNNK